MMIVIDNRPFSQSDKIGHGLSLIPMQGNVVRGKRVENYDENIGPFIAGRADLH